MRLDTRWFTEYYEELADVNNLLDDFNVLQLVIYYVKRFTSLYAHLTTHAHR